MPKVSKLRLAFEGKDLSNCGWGRFWKEDGSPQCPLAVLYGPTAPKTDEDPQESFDSWMKAFEVLSALYGKEYEEFPEAYDHFREQGLNATQAIEKTLEYLETVILKDEDL